MIAPVPAPIAPPVSAPVAVRSGVPSGVWQPARHKLATTSPKTICLFTQPSLFLVVFVASVPRRGPARGFGDSPSKSQVSNPFLGLLLGICEHRVAAGYISCPNSGFLAAAYLFPFVTAASPI